MQGINNIVVGGNLTKDPEVREVGGEGNLVADFSIAINESYLDKATNEKKEKVVYLDCSAWGGLAKVARDYCKKGKAVLLEGKLEQSSWEDKETGQKRSKLRVQARRLHLLGGKPEGAGEGSPAGATASATGGGFGDW